MNWDLIVNNIGFGLGLLALIGIGFGFGRIYQQYLDSKKKYDKNNTS